jgi:tRNA(fMet)-specific endonuclease VapC
MKYLLDTDHLSILQKSMGQDYQNLSSRMEKIPLSEFAISIVTIHEQFLGSNAYISRAQNDRDLVRGYDFMTRLVKDLRVIPVVNFDDAAVAVFRDFQSQRIKLATMDLRIAAIAKSQSLILLTRNRKDFEKVPELSIEDWTDSTRSH